MAGTAPGRKTPEPPERTRAEPTLPGPDVVAAGTVVIRKGKVLVVHRPKYLDWSFPKGKQDPGEPDVLTAVRETVEETGVEVRLGLPLPSQAYVQHDGRTKVVHYWRADVLGSPDVSGFAANSEVDKVLWLPLDEAATTLTYHRDRMTLADAREHLKRTTPLVILRHGKAVGRKSWDRPDVLRPLNLEGEQQAREIRPLLAAYGVTRVVTSTSARCAQTVRPYAAEKSLRVNATEVLSEEHAGNPADAFALLDRLLRRAEPTVLCSHRPLLPHLLGHLGVEVPTMSPADMVVVHHRGGTVRAAELLETT